MYVKNIVAASEKMDCSVSRADAGDKVSVNRNACKEADSRPTGASPTVVGSAAGVSKTTRGLAIVEALAEDFRHGSSSAWWCCLLVSSAAAVATRLYCLQRPYTIIWDETHFGKMVSLYLNGTYFFDVHPPGGKMVLTLFALLSGYNGTFSFERPGLSYEDYPELMTLRMFCALLGASLAPLAFGSAWTMTRRLPSALLAAVFVIVEIGTLTLSKFILLDSPLMFFMMVTFFCLCRLHQSSKSGTFSRGWWTSLVATGVGLGCVVSVKFVGLFMVAVVGLYTVHELWELFGTQGWLQLLYHLLARVLALVVVPVMVYISFFAIHDALLYKSDSLFYFQEATHSPGFQMRLLGNNLYNLSQPREVAYGNLVTVRNSGVSGGYLQSSNYTYPYKVHPKKPQLVIAAGIKIPDNFMQILFAKEEPDLADGFYSDPVEWVTDGDLVRLRHNSTGALLGCSSVKAAVSARHYLVYSSWPNDTNSDTEKMQFLWKISLIKDLAVDEASKTKLNQDSEETSINTVKTSDSKSAENRELQKENQENEVEGDPISALYSGVRFQCVGVPGGGCFLTWTRKRLPATWGFAHEEVTCSINRNDPFNKWVIEQNINPHLPNHSNFQQLQSTLMERFQESHRVMFFRNNRMKAISADRFTQKPWMWPIGYSAHPWFDDGIRVVLLANPFVILLNAGALASVAVFLARKAYLKKRVPEQEQEQDLTRLEFWCRWLLIAYLLHYVPFYMMDRILYFHHYFPALQFSSLLTAVLCGHWLCKLRTALRTLAATCVLVSALLCSFFLYCNVSYGYNTVGSYNSDNSTYGHLRVWEHWEI